MQNQAFVFILTVFILTVVAIEHTDENQVHGPVGKGTGMGVTKLQARSSAVDKHAAFMDKLVADGFVNWVARLAKVTVMMRYL